MQQAPPALLLHQPLLPPLHPPPVDGAWDGNAADIGGADVGGGGDGAGGGGGGGAGDGGGGAGGGGGGGGNRSSVSSEGFCENDLGDLGPSEVGSVHNQLLVRQDSDDPALGSDTNEVPSLFC